MLRGKDGKVTVPKNGSWVTGLPTNPARADTEVALPWYLVAIKLSKSVVALVDDSGVSSASKCLVDIEFYELNPYANEYVVGEDKWRSGASATLRAESGVFRMLIFPCTAPVLTLVT